MNFWTRFTFLPTCIVLLLLTGCNNDDSTSVESNRLVGTWEVQSVFLDDFDVTSPSYEAFAILFRPDGSYFTVDGDPVFTEAGGFWRFLEGDDARIELGSVEADLVFRNNDSELSIFFIAPEGQIGSSSRIILGLSGEYEFHLVSSEQDIEP